MTLELTWGITDEEFEQEMKLIAESGITWGRVGMAWYDIERTGKGQYYEPGIAMIDKAVERLTKLGVNIIAEIDFVPDWANGAVGQRYKPATVAQNWKDYVTYCVDRWGDTVKHWGIWNEPNHPSFFYPTPNAATYTTILKDAYAAAKAADPTCKVVLGGLSFNDYTFLEAMYTAEPNLNNYFDIIDLHPYTRGGVGPSVVYNDGPGGRISKDSFTGYKEVGEVIASHGSRKPIWFTEMGWSTNNNPAQTLGGVSEALQAQYTEEAFRIMQEQYLKQEDYYVSVACVYILRQSWVGPGGEAASPGDWVTHLSLVKYDWTRKPAFETLCGIRGEGWEL